MKGYLAIYDRKRGPISLTEFPTFHEAWLGRVEAERLYSPEGEVEVCALRGESLEALARTHGRYVPHYGTPSETVTIVAA